MDITRSQSAELRHRQQQEAANQQQQERAVGPSSGRTATQSLIPDPSPVNPSSGSVVVDEVEVGMANPVDPRGQTVQIEARRFSDPVSFDDVPPSDHKRIAEIPWFHRASVLADDEEDFESISLYSWDGEFYWGVGIGALAFRVWQRIIAVDDQDLSSYGTIDVKRTRHVAAVAKGLQTFAGEPAVYDEVDVDLWRYRVFSERPYVENLCPFTEEDLAPWRGRYIVHEKALCWQRAILKSESRYLSRAESTYWNVQLRWERGTLSLLGRLVPYHFQCCYNLTETARDRLLVRIPSAYDRLAVCQGFLFEQGPIFTYKSSTFIDDPETGLWVVAFTERIVRVCAALLESAYGQYRLWHVPADIIAFARELGFAMEVPMGSRANVCEVLEILDVIAATDFTSLPDTWRERQDCAIDYHPGRTRRGGDYFFYDPWHGQKIDEHSASVRADTVRVIPDDMDCGWVNVDEDVERTPRDDSRD